MLDPLDMKPLEIEDHLRKLIPEERTKILDWIKTSKQRDAQIREAVENMSKSMDTLRVLIKYTMFDLEATRREKVALQERIAQLQGDLDEDDFVEQFLEPDPGDYMMQLSEGEGGLKDLPEIGDFIHNSECDHPYDAHCWCEHCEACRIRMQQHGEGAD